MMSEKKINETVDFERRGINIRVLAWIGAGIIAAAIVMHFGLYWLYWGFTTEQTRAGVPSSVQNLPPQSAEPQLQVYPVADMKQLRAEQEQKLNSYGWINREQGIVRIPIEQAMSIIAGRGLPQTKTQNVRTAPTPEQKQK